MHMAPITISRTPMTPYDVMAPFKNNTAKNNVNMGVVAVSAVTCRASLPFSK